GTATITATYGDFSATCTVTVKAIIVEITGEGVENGAIDLEVDGTLQLNASVKENGDELEGAEIEWESADTAVATVDENGLVTAVAPGEAKITATRKGGVQTASVTVTVLEPAGYAKVTDKEQNKQEANAWGYWGDQGYNWGSTTISNPYSEAYREENENLADGYKYIGAGKMNLIYTIDSFKTEEEMGDTFKDNKYSAIQLFYRSAGEDGKLETNHNYTVKFTILSTAAGTAVINPYDDAEDLRFATNNLDAHKVELEADVAKTVEITFRHGDTGAIYRAGVYQNIESAMDILLGLVGEVGQQVKVSVYDIQFKDLGESTYKWEDVDSELDGWVDPELALRPSHPETESEYIADAVTATGVTLSVQGEGDAAKAVYNLAGTIDMTKFDSKEAAETWLLGLYFDLQEWNGSWANYAAGRLSADIDESEGTFVIHYDITYTPVGGTYYNRFNRKAAGGDLADLVLSTEAAVPGETITVGNKKYTIVNDPDQAFGLVAIKVEKA
ncbi:MAG: Ig-like domain-containing protein, partial [Clostridia bacterium]|nr:Ig-like domain-containing protein [Clostridia bacterium]